MRDLFMAPTIVKTDIVQTKMIDTEIRMSGDGDRTAKGCVIELNSKAKGFEGRRKKIVAVPSLNRIKIYRHPTQNTYLDFVKRI
jgi:hypothetical protein